MIDIVFEASIADVLDSYVSDERIRNALFGQAIIAAYGGPKDPGTASIKLMHYQGDLEGQGPVWGYVKGGMGMISFAIADAAREAGAQLACGVPVSEIVPEQGVRLEDGTLIRARTVICNADPKVALGLLDGQDVPADYRERLEAWKVRSPVVKFNAALSALPEWTAAPGETWPAHATINCTGSLDEAQAAFEALRPRRAGRRLRRGLHPDGLRPVAGAGGPPPAERVRPVRAVRARAGHVGRAPRRGRPPVHRPDRALRAGLREPASSTARCSARPTSRRASA